MKCFYFGTPFENEWRRWSRSWNRHTQRQREGERNSHSESKKSKCVQPFMHVSVLIFIHKYTALGNLLVHSSARLHAQRLTSSSGTHTWTHTRSRQEHFMVCYCCCFCFWCWACISSASKKSIFIYLSAIRISYGLSFDDILKRRRRSEKSAQKNTQS